MYREILSSGSMSRPLLPRRIRRRNNLLRRRRRASLAFALLLDSLELAALLGCFQFSTGGAVRFRQVEMILRALRLEPDRSLQLLNCRRGLSGGQQSTAQRVVSQGIVWRPLQSLASRSYCLFGIALRER